MRWTTALADSTSKMLLRVAASVFLLSLQMTIYSSNAQAGEILIPPTSQRLPIGTTATFFCRARGTTQWVIDGTIIGFANQRNFEARGFSFTSVPGSNLVFNVTVTFEASVEKNGTEIRCTAYLQQQAASEIATLTVMGPPAQVNLTLQVVNPTLLQVSWEPPFSWEEYPLQNYNVRVEDETNDEVLRDVVVDLSTDGSTVMFKLNRETQAQICADLVFTVSASNELGQSSPATVTGGFPIVPGPFSSPVKIIVVFQADGSPQVDIQFGLPPVCPYQQLTYTIVVEGTNFIEVIGPKDYSTANGLMVTETISSGLVTHAEYSIRVTVTTVTGSTTTTATFITDFEQPTQPSTNGTTNDDKSDGPLVVIIIVVVSVATALIAIAGITAVSIFMSVQYKRKQVKSHPPMVTNPIYEGPIYETIDDKFDALTPTSQESPYQGSPFYMGRSMPDGVESQVSMSDPKREYENCKALSNDKVPASLPKEDSYTLMNPAGSVTYLQLGPGKEGDSNAPQPRDNSSIRYVSTEC